MPQAARITNRLVFALLVVLLSASGSATETVTLRLWPDRAPGEKQALPPEGDQYNPTDKGVAGRPVTIRANVSDPTITFYPVAHSKNSGAAVLVCPGGGYYILALDLEGTEVCHWLNSIGVTAILLKYRVPRREGRLPHAAPLEDAQRALGLIRSQAAAYGVDPQRIGVLGFSAGANLAAILSNNHESRVYAAVDRADEASCRPDFCVLVYPAYLTGEPPGTHLAPELRVANNRTPPTFLAMTEDDDVGVEGALTYYLALKQAQVPAEMHLYPKGGHGYGLRRTDATVTTWPDRLAAWMQVEKLSDRSGAP